MHKERGQRPGYHESGKGSWPQSLDQVFKPRLNKDNQAVGEGEEVGHPPRVLRVAVLRPDLVVGGDQGAVAPGRAQAGRGLRKEEVALDMEEVAEVEEECASTSRKVRAPMAITAGSSMSNEFRVLT